MLFTQITFLLCLTFSFKMGAVIVGPEGCLSQCVNTGAGLVCCGADATPTCLPPCGGGGSVST